MHYNIPHSSPLKEGSYTTKRKRTAQTSVHASHHTYTESHDMQSQRCEVFTLLTSSTWITSHLRRQFRVGTRSEFHFLRLRGIAIYSFRSLRVIYIFQNTIQNSPIVFSSPSLRPSWSWWQCLILPSVSRTWNENGSEPSQSQPEAITDQDINLVTNFKGLGLCLAIMLSFLSFLSLLHPFSGVRMYQIEFCMQYML